MLDQILTKLGLADYSASEAHAHADSRRYVRHPGHQAEVSVGDRVYSVSDWSLGGLLFDPAGEENMSVGDNVEINLKFRLPHATVSISQTARIVRAAKRGMAAEFMPLSTAARRQFDRVIDGFHAQSFLESQVA